MGDAFPHPWDEACREKLRRRNPVTNDLEAIEPGVNFFVLQIERLGGVTSFSCEGHPTGFYVTFAAPYETALRIAEGEYFTVELAGRDKWALRCRAELSYDLFTEDDRRRILRHAAENWHMKFGGWKA